ncbi:exportin-like protein [Blastocystis sp. subtype 4]|uniref:exportin-like protein n=1 Tax=Blastocystis sp. subtype 4 TaxID=944170 RepID=UPI0007119D90|nr:exportin-like protein [Blastocystis sp. subtype 4]KNB46425.1 exportin-like protein [Blastocystis sp. subtype 4]|eukprot:XP_014529868.1 exportin-like protein [Blastocystis sp. subtype 4]
MRGIVNTCTSKRDFNIFFEALYPRGFEVMRHALHDHCNDPEIVSAILKFVSSLALNRESRIDYCNDIANGVTLFRETSTVLLEYGTVLLNNFPSFVNCSDTVYKGICQLFQVMERFLKGHYIPFGVFSLYNDSCLSDLLSMYLQIVIRTPFNQLSQLPKYENSVFVFLELLFADHLATVSSIETTAFISIMDSVCNGVASFNSEVVKCSARILDNVATYLYFNQYKPTETVANIKRIMQAQPNFWDVVMTSVLNAFIFGSANTIWDLSRPIYSVYLVKRDSLDHYLTNASANQTQQTVLQLMEDTKELTKDVDLAMGVTARDEFSKKATKEEKEKEVPLYLVELDMRAMVVMNLNTDELDQ